MLERCYTDETPYPIKYAGTEPDDADTDGDGVRDGADDQDHDDIPNIMELSRRPGRDTDHYDARTLQRSRARICRRQAWVNPLRPLPPALAVADVPCHHRP